MVNTTNQDVTLNSTLASETPRYDRNPFQLTLLAPEAINTRGEILPFLSWSANSVDLGGEPTSRVPTPLEAKGDYSQSYNIDGSLKKVYDPWSTVYDPNTNAYTRTQFPGNTCVAGVDQEF